MKSKLSVLRAIIWLHLLRLLRYKYGFLNMILTDTMWYMIFLLGALMFVPKYEFEVAAVITFWGIVLWIVLNDWVWLIGDWTWFAISAGLVDEHIVYGVNPLTFIGGRVLTASLVTCISLPVVLTIFSSIAGTAIFTVYSPVYLVLGFSLMIVYSTMYALLLVALSLRTSVPSIMLDVSTVILYIVGGLGVPVNRMPEPMRIFSILIPYTHAAEIVRYGALGLKPYYGLELELLFSLVHVAALGVISIATIRYSLNHVRRYGVRAVGVM
ncbi:MAG: hypothetical protein DRO13_02510 [Thermoprotei archaeon]|nr:MAG: hypothetical protein DRO13_02510 [Thermoprotei archaeon]